jgi:hypothetical protein
MSVSTVSQAGGEGLHAAVKDESTARTKYGPKAQRRSEERQSYERPWNKEGCTEHSLATVRSVRTVEDYSGDFTAGRPCHYHNSNE